MDFIKHFFGFKSNDSNHKIHEPPHQFSEEFKSVFDNFEEEENIPRRGFDIFTDPLEMHKYFEQQMDYMLRNFGFPNFGTNFRLFGTLTPEEHKNDQNADTNLREHFLKKGYKTQPSTRKQDTDLDADLQTGNLDLFLGNKDNKSSKQLVPFEKQETPHFFHHSVSVKTVTQPDGTIEIQRTIKGSDGAEETTITRHKDGKEYSIIRKRDKYGHEEVVENLVNMDESEKDMFLFKNTPSIKKPSNLYDKFFGKC